MIESLLSNGVFLWHIHAITAGVLLFLLVFLGVFIWAARYIVRAAKDVSADSPVVRRKLEDMSYSLNHYISPKMNALGDIHSELDRIECHISEECCSDYNLDEFMGEIINIRFQGDKSYTPFLLEGYARLGVEGRHGALNTQVLVPWSSIAELQMPCDMDPVGEDDVDVVDEKPVGDPLGTVAGYTEGPVITLGCPTFHPEQNVTVMVHGIPHRLVRMQ